MNSKPCNIGVNIPPKAFQKEHIVDGSLVQLHTSGGVTGFNCSDAQAQELVRILLYWAQNLDLQGGGWVRPMGEATED